MIFQIEILKYLVLAWLFAFAGMILLRLLDGRISTRGLLCERPGETVRAERVQMLIATFVAAGYYVMITLEQDDLAQGLPEVPGFVLAALGGSQLLYVFRKLATNRPV